MIRLLQYVRFSQTFYLGLPSFLTKTFMLRSFVIFMSFLCSFSTFAADHLSSLSPDLNAGEDVTTCRGTSVQLEAAGTGNFIWTPATGLSCISCSNPIAMPDVTTQYIVTCDDGGGNISTDTVIVTILPTATINTISTSEPTGCDINDGEIIIDATDGGVAIEYSITNGLIWQASNTFSSLSGGNYNIKVRNAEDNSCEVDFGEVNLPVPFAPVVDNTFIVEPTDCGTLTGTIGLDISGGSTVYQYSHDNGNTWQSGNTFTNLPAGFYPLRVRNINMTCDISAGTILLSDPELPVIAEVIRMQPACGGGSDGSITIVTEEYLGILQYSINGGLEWFPDHVFTGLAAGDYNVSVRLQSPATSCIAFFDENPIRFGGLDGPPTLDGASPENSTSCSSPNGRITIFASGGSASYEYSIDNGNTWQSSSVFMGLSGGTYQPVVRNDDGSCPITGSTITLTEPSSPMIDDISSTSPMNCDEMTGTITITASGGEGAPYLYSLNGGTAQSENVFNNLGGGDYIVVVSNGDGSCEVIGETQTLIQPNVPVIDDITKTDPTTCGAPNGMITIEVTGDINIYEYSIDDGITYEVNNVFNALEADTYIVKIRNAADDSCETAGEIVVLDAPASPSIDNIEVTQPTNCDDPNGVIVITSNNADANFMYSITGGAPYQASNTFSSLEDGTYTIAIQNGACETINPTTTILNPAELPVINGVSVIQPTGCGDSNTGSITIFASGNNLEYTVHGDMDWQGANFFGNLPAGIYDIRVRKVGGICEVAAPMEVLTAGNSPTITGVSFTDPTDCNVNNGTITITASGDADLEYSVTGGNSWQATNIFGSLEGISYDVRVRYVDGACEEAWPGGVTLTAPTAPNIDAVNMTDINDCTSNNGMIVITASGGTGSYEYTIDGGSNWESTATFNNLAPDTYSIGIRNDSPSCEVFGGSTIISAPNPPVVNDIVLSDPTGCGLSDGIITIAASGEDALEHSIDNGVTWQLSNNFTDLPEGSYRIRVRYTNMTCMIAGADQALVASSAADISQIIMDNPDCSGVNGQIEIVVDYTGTAPLEYTVNDGVDWQLSNIFTGLEEGTYPIQVRVSGEGGCITSGGASILEEHEPPMITFVNSSPPSNCEASDGFIQVIVSGNNTGGFEFSIDGGDTWTPTNTFSDLGSGDYIPAVRPVNTPCIILGDAFSLEQPNAPMIDDIAVVHPDCDVNDGSITITASGGSGDYQYTINNGTNWQDSNFFNNLIEGNYLVGVRNADTTCETTASDITTLIEPDRPLVSMVNSTNPTCEMSNGTIEVTASGGTGSLEYSANGGVDWQSSNVFSNLGIGTYEVLVRNDEPSCATPAATIQLTEPAAPQMSEINITHPTNCEVSNGSIQIIASGVGTLEYSINDGVDWQLSPAFNNLPQGTYIVKIRFEDGTCETLGGTIILEDPEMPMIDIVDVAEPSDCDLADAVITITTIEDESNYEFSINGGDTWQASNVFSGLGAGEYQIAVRNADSAGSCVIFGDVITIKAQEMPIIDSVTFEDPDCEMNNGSITINATSNGDLEYSIDNGDNWSTNPIFTDLGEAIYQILVRNINGTCEVSSGSMSLNEPAAPNVVNFDATNPDCNGDNGSIIIIANGGQIPLQYSIDGGTTYQESNEFLGLSPNTYDIYVRNGDESCPVYGGTTELIVPNPPGVIQITTTNSTQCSDTNPDGTITISTNDVNVEYSIDGGTTWQTAPIFNNLVGGTYNVLARNIGEECSISVGIVTIEEPTPPAFSVINRTNPSDCTITDGSIEIVPEGNIILMYSIDGGETYQSSNTFNNLAAEEYTIFISNENGSCATNIGTVILTAPAQPVINQVNIANSICVENSGTIQIVASGGVGNLEYTNDGGTTWQSSNLFLNLAPSTYTPGVRNNDGTCAIIDEPITIVEIGAPEITDVTFTHPSDCGLSDGSITITAMTDEGVLEYSINDGETWETSGMYENLLGGIYQILVRNDPEAICQATADDVILTGGEEPVINEVTVVNPSECDVNDGIIQILASGTNGLEYSIDGGETWQSTNTFTDLSGGTYEALVRNDNGGCEVSDGDVVVIAPTLPTITSINVTDVVDCSIDDGQIEIIASGDDNLQYSIDGGMNFQSDPIFEGLSAGTYDIMVQNANSSCLVDGEEVTIDGVAQPIITEIVMEEPSSCMINDGRILIFINLDRNDFEFSVDGGANFQESHIFEGLPAGDYDIRIRYLNNTCEVEAVADVTLEGETIIITAVNTSGPSTCGASDGFLDISLSAEGLYEYSIDNGVNWQSMNFFDGLTAGNYTIKVRNVDGSCETESEMVTLFDPNFPSITAINEGNPSSCRVQDGTIEIIANGDNTLQYSIDGGETFQMDNIFTNLGEGAYNIQVSYTDGGCVIENDFTISLAASDQPSVTNLSSTEPTNCDSNDGTIIITATGTSDIVYSIDGGNTYQTDNTFTGLSGGEYIVFVSYEDGVCAQNAGVITLTEPATPSIDNINADNPSACGQNDGRIEILASGTNPLEYSINGGEDWQSSNVFENLGDGTYAVQVRYEGGACLVLTDAPIILTSSSDLTISEVTATPAGDCAEENGTITILLDSGADNIEYSIDDGSTYQTSNTFTDLSGGEYTIRVRAAGSDCEAIYDNNPVLVEGGNGVLISNVVSETPSDCGLSDGRIIITADCEDPEATCNLEYSIDGGQNYESTNVFEGLSSGNYDVRVRKTDGTCPVIWGDIAVISLTPPTIESVAFEHPTDCGDANGTITITANGENQLEYSIDAGETWQSSNQFTDLSEGLYPIQVRIENSSCIVEYEEVIVLESCCLIRFVLEELDNGQYQVSMIPDTTLTEPDNATMDMRVTIVVPVQGFELDNFESASPMYGFEVNTINEPAQNPNFDYINVTLATTTMQIPYNQGVSVPLFTFENTDLCADHGEMLNIMQNQTDPFQDEVVGNIVSIFGIADEDITICTFGTGSAPIYSVLQNVEVSQPSACDAEDGSINIITDCPISSCTYEYSIDGGITFGDENVFENLPIGEYNVVVRSINENCDIEYGNNPIQLGTGDEPVINNVTTVDPSTCTATNGSIQISAIGDNLEYSIDGGNTYQTSSMFQNLGAGDYTIIVRADGNCAIPYTLNPVSLIPLDGAGATMITNVETTDPSCSNDDGSIVVIAESCGEVEYSIDGENWQSENTFTNLMGGVYTATVRSIADNTVSDSQPAIVLTTQVVCSDTIMITIPNETTVVCLDEVLDVPNGPGVVSICQEGEQVELVLVQEESCFSIIPDEDFTGIDMVCVVICDVVDATLCDTTVIFISVEELEVLDINPDTTFVTIPHDMTSTECITQFIDTPNGVGNTTICNNPEDINVNLNIENDEVCVSLQPINGFLGTDTVCVVVCDLFAPELCDTTIIIVTVESDDIVPLPDTIRDETIINTPIEICLDEYMLPAENVVLTSCGEPMDGTLTFDGICLTYDPNFNFLGIDTMCVMVCDANDATNCEMVTVIITVEPGDFEPLPEVIYDETLINTPITLCLDDYILPAENVVLSSCEDPMDGDITFDGICLTYDPDFNFLGMDTMCVMVCDIADASNCDMVTVIINVVPEDLVPLQDTIRDETLINTPITLCMEDYILPWESVVLNSCGEPDNGDMSINGTCLTYNPDFNFLGDDEMCVMVCDATNTEDCQMVTIFIVVEPGDLVELPETILDTTLINTPITVCMDDYILPWEDVVLSSCGEPTDGDISINGSCITYEPDFNFLGNDEMCIMVCDATNTEDCQMVDIIITVEPGDLVELPETILDTTLINTPITVCMEDNYILPWESVILNSCDEPTNGDMSINGACITYEPDFNFLGNDEMCIMVCDATNSEDCQMVEIIITVEPGNLVELPEMILDTTLINTPITICMEDNYILPWESVVLNSCDEPTNGDMSINSTCITYEPDFNFLGNDDMCVMVCDATNPEDCQMVEIIITVEPGDLVELPETIQDTTLINTPIDVCLDEYILPWEHIFLSSCGAASNGDVTYDGTCITYDPDFNFLGMDTTCIVLCNALDSTSCDTVYLVITVEQGDLVPLPDTIYDTTLINTPITVCVDDYILPWPDVFLSNCGSPDNGEIFIDGDCIIYDPDFNFLGNDEMCVMVCDATNADSCQMLTIIITVEPGDEVVLPETIRDETTINTPIEICLEEYILPAENVVLTSCGEPMDGTLTFDGTCLTYDPDFNFLGIDTMCVMVCDVNDATNCEMVTVIITVEPGDFEPLPEVIYDETLINTPITLCLDDYILPAENVVLSSCEDPMDGDITFNGICLTYDPDFNFLGMDTMCVMVCDVADASNCDTVAVIITVVPGDLIPLQDTIYDETLINTPITLCMEDNYILPWESVVLNSCGEPDNGDMSINGTCLTYDPDFNFLGDDEMCVMVCDATNPEDCQMVTVFITVEPGDLVELPEMILDTTLINTPITVCMDDYILPWEDVVLSSCGEPTDGDISINGACITYEPDFNFLGNDEMCIMVCDANNPEDCQMVDIIITVEPGDLVELPETILDTTLINTPITICMEDNYILPWESVVLNSCDEPTNGDMSINGTCITYEPDFNFLGDDEMCVMVCDATNTEDCQMVTVFITVEPGDLVELPETILDTTLMNTPITICMEDNYILPWESVVLNSCDEPTDGDMSINGTCITYEPDFNFIGNDEMCVMVCDATNTDDCQMVEIIITVEPGDLVELPETIQDTTLINTPIDVCLDDYILPWEHIFLSSCGAASNGDVTYDGTCITYDPDFNFLGMDTTCVVLCNALDTTSCDTVYLVITVEQGDLVPLPQTVYDTTLINTPIDVCVDDYILPWPDVFLNNCGSPDNGEMFISSNCITYDPDFNFLGTDTMCVMVCDATNADSCQMLTVIITVDPGDMIPVPDTIREVTEIETPVEICLDEYILPAEDVELTACGAPMDGALTLGGTCVTYTPNTGFLGLDTMCVSICDINDASNCDTTIIIIEVTPSTDCEEAIFEEDELRFVSTETEICVPIPLNESSNYQVSLDGEPYNLPLEACESDTFVTYTYDLVPGQLADGPYNIETWIVNDTAFAGLIPDAAGLANFFNFWDSDGNWMIDLDNQSISGGDGISEYDSLVIRQESTGDMITLFPVVTEIVGGFAVTVSGEGTHTLSVQNTTTGCSDDIIIILDDGVFNEDTIRVVTDYETPTDTICVDISILEGEVISQTICDEPTNGTVDSTDINCFIYTPDDGFSGLDTFCIVLCDDSATAICDTSIVIVEVLPDDCGIFEMDEMTIMLEDCDSTAQLCLNIDLADFSNYELLDNGAAFGGEIDGCNFDTTFRYPYFTLPDVGIAGPYTVDSWAVNGMIFSGGFPNIAALADSMNVWDPTGNWIVDGAAFALIGGNPANTYGTMAISQDNTGANAVLVPTSELFPAGTSISLVAGTHNLTLTNTVTGCRDMMQVTVDCQMDTMGVFEDTTIDIITHVGQPETICLDETLGINAEDITSITNICEDQSTGNVNFILDTLTSCIILESLTIGVDTACFEVCMMDTCVVVTINVTVQESCEDFIDFEVTGTGIDCETQDTILCVPIPLGEMVNYSVEADGEPYEDVMIACNLDSMFTYTYFSLLQLGDGPFNVDSWTVNQDTFMGQFTDVADLVDSLNVWDPSTTWSFDESILIIRGANTANDYGPIRVTEIASGGMAALELNASLVPRGTGFQLGLGTHELVFTHIETGCRDTILGTIACMTSETIFDTISIADIEQICLDTFELQGDFVSISNACPEESGELVVFNIDSDSLCVTYEGFEPGTERACIIVCDDLGVCDTTYIVVTVLEMDGDLDAVDDLGTTAQGETIVIDVFTNDIIPNNTLDTFYIVTEPSLGTAEFDDNGLITYVHDGEDCDVVDNFTYAICNAFACDTAVVTIDIPCDTLDGEFNIYPGFSPNGDGVNETFTITGLDEFPNNRLQIFNRWGNLVYDVGGYRNDWKGTWNGNDLPDGTYFYLLDLGNGEKVMSGYLVIMR